MTISEVKVEHKDLLLLLQTILDSSGITLEEDYNSNIPYLGSSLINKKEGFYVRLKQRSNLSAKQLDIINNSFPIKMRNEKDIYVVNMLSYSDFDWDDDRTWQPSISIEIIKNGKPLL
jgi:hypothetical protein